VIIPQTGLPELVEGPFFSWFGKEEGTGFDKLSQAGVGVSGVLL
jgi:hypothetical protein